MSTLTVPHQAGSFGHAAFAKALKSLKALAAHVRHERQVRAAVRELSAMSDHMLADLGLTRGEIERAVRGARR